MNGKQLKKQLEEFGWYCIRVKGSHHIMAKEGHKRVVPIPIHAGRDITKAMTKEILKEAGIKEK